MTDSAAPAQPKAVLRGHKSQVHAAAFVRSNDRLVTGDADGFVVVWDLTTMRPQAVWRAHTKAVLGIAGWGQEAIITHGRDHKLIVWKLAASDEESLSSALPLDASPQVRPEPWILHMLEVNTMNFCAFSACAPRPKKSASDEELLIAVPHTLGSEAIDIFHLPSQSRVETVKLGAKNGMVMALALFYRGDVLTLAAGYENGLAVVASPNEQGTWREEYHAQSHAQPILSLDVDVECGFFLTSSADSLLVKHPIPSLSRPEAENRGLQHENEQPALGQPVQTTPPKEQPSDKPISLLSAALAKEPRPPRKQPTAPVDESSVVTDPIQVANTKHAGQQSLTLRSDRRIFATGGWDSRVRVYSAKTMKEVAVLKWHQGGCYAVAFSDVNLPVVDGKTGGKKTDPEDTAVEGQQLIPRMVTLSVKERRIRHAESAHWLAAGSKDGKVSVWDIF